MHSLHLTYEYLCHIHNIQSISELVISHAAHSMDKWLLHAELRVLIPARLREVG